MPVERNVAQNVPVRDSQGTLSGLAGTKLYRHLLVENAAGCGAKPRALFRSLRSSRSSNTLKRAKSRSGNEFTQ
jgi:hypothetical protein